MKKMCYNSSCSAGVAHPVERHLAKVEVASSSLVTRSSFSPQASACGVSVSKKSFRHAVRIFKLSKKFKNTCRLNAKGAFCPLHTSPAALSQTSSARFFDSLTYSIPALL